MSTHNLKLVISNMYNMSCSLVFTIKVNGHKLYKNCWQNTKAL